MLTPDLLTVAVSAFLASLLLTPIARAAPPSWGLLDHPNARSSHSGVIPRTGGLAVLASVSLPLLVYADVWSRRPEATALLVGTLILSAVGVCDDRGDVPPLLRLVVQIATAIGLVAFAGPLERLPFPAPLDVSLGPLGPVVSVVWLVGVVNFFNFMDGIDGIAGVQAVVAGTGLAVAGFDPLVSLLGAALAAAAAGFLVYNWAPATVFLGDAGSSAIGFLFAGLPFISTQLPRPAAVSFVALTLWFFLADATLTLLRRLVRGERIHEAHREHLYQRLVIAGWSHGRVTAALGFAAATVTVLSLLALWDGGLRSAWPLFLLALSVTAGEVVLVRHVEQTRRGAGSPHSLDRGH